MDWKSQLEELSRQLAREKNESATESPLMHMRDYTQRIRKTFGSNVRADIAYKQKCKEEFEELLHSFVDQLQRVITRELRVQAMRTRSLCATVYAKDALRPLEAHEMNAIQQVRQRDDGYDVQDFHNKVKSEVRDWLRVHGYRIIELDIHRGRNTGATLKLTLSLQGATRLRGLVRFIIVCARYKRDFYAPGAPGYVSAKESFEKQLY